MIIEDIPETLRNTRVSHERKKVQYRVMLKEKKWLGVNFFRLTWVISLIVLTKTTNITIYISYTWFGYNTSWNC